MSYSVLLMVTRCESLYKAASISAMHSVYLAPMFLLTHLMCVATAYYSGEIFESLTQKGRTRSAIELTSFGRKRVPPEC